MIADFLTPAVIVANLSWRKADLIDALLHQLLVAESIPAGDLPAIRSAVLAREALGSTGIGRGVAIPHAHCRGIADRVGVFAVCRPAVEFDSIDGEPVDVAVLLLTPPSRPGDYLRVDPVGVWLVRRFRDDEFLHRLRAADTPEELESILKKP